MPHAACYLLAFPTADLVKVGWATDVYDRAAKLALHWGPVDWTKSAAVIGTKRVVKPLEQLVHSQLVTHRPESVPQHDGHTEMFRPSAAPVARALLEQLATTLGPGCRWHHCLAAPMATSGATRPRRTDTASLTAARAARREARRAAQHEKAAFAEAHEAPAASALLGHLRTWWDAIAPWVVATSGPTTGELHAVFPPDHPLNTTTHPLWRAAWDGYRRTTPNGTTWVNLMTGSISGVAYGAPPHRDPRELLSVTLHLPAIYDPMTTWPAVAAAAEAAWTPLAAALATLPTVTTQGRKRDRALLALARHPSWGKPR